MNKRPEDKREGSSPLGQLEANEIAQVSDGVLATQLSELNQRVRMHATRLWQLPFAYMGVVALLLSTLERAGPRPVLLAIVSIVVLLGIVVLACMLGAYEGVARGTREIGLLEKRLGLTSTVRLGSDWLENLAATHVVQRLTWHFLPYFAIVVLAGAGLGAVAVIATSQHIPDSLRFEDSATGENPARRLDPADSQTQDRRSEEAD